MSQTDKIKIVGSNFSLKFSFLQKKRPTRILHYELTEKKFQTQDTRILVGIIYCNKSSERAHAVYRKTIFT